MPQTFQVLKCYKCFVFQMHQVKKSNKFECKLCGEKQSIKRHYGLGTGKECRIHVQKLNTIRGCTNDLNSSISSDEENCEEIENINVKCERKSKWSEYVEKSEIGITEPVVNDMYLGDTEVVLEVPSKQRKFAKRNFSNKSKVSFKHEDVDELSPRESIIIPIKYKQYNIHDNTIKLETETPSTSKQTMRKKFIPPTCSKLSKWAEYTDDASQDLGENNSTEESDTFTGKDSILEPNHNSYDKVCDSQRNVINNGNTNTTRKIRKFCRHTPVSISSESQTKKIFSLCNDNDLDNILDI